MAKAIKQNRPVANDSGEQVSCSQSEHVHATPAAAPVNQRAVEQASRIFRALGDSARLRLAARLARGEACVTELAGLEQESITTISQRLRILRSDNIVRRRRDGKHVLYVLSDRHVLDLVLNGLAHVSETHHPSAEADPDTTPERRSIMANDHLIHEDHAHTHDSECGHTAVEHNGHTDFLHDGHLHHLHEGHVDEHRIEVSQENPDNCTDGHECDGHDAAHVHGADCGHEAVPHGDHTDYLVDGHLHHQDGDHCDNHGNITIVK